MNHFPPNIGKVVTACDTLQVAALGTMRVKCIQTNQFWLRTSIGDPYPLVIQGGLDNPPFFLLLN